MLIFSSLTKVISKGVLFICFSAQVIRKIKVQLLYSFPFSWGYQYEIYESIQIKSDTKTFSGSLFQKLLRYGTLAHSALCTHLLHHKETLWKTILKVQNEVGKLLQFDVSKPIFSVTSQSRVGPNYSNYSNGKVVFDHGPNS